MNSLVKLPESEETRTDEQLVDHAVAGDSEAFACLYERLYERAFRLAFNMTGEHGAAQDLTQEIFMRAYLKLGEFGGRSSFATWFYRLAINQSINYRRRSPGRREEEFNEMNVVLRSHGGEQIETDVLRRQVHEQIRSALLDLKPKLRIAVILRDIDGLGYDEIADRLSCSTGTVASRLNRARRILAKKLEHLKGAY